MSKLTTKIAVPIILVGVFVVAVFVAINIGFTELNIGSYLIILCLAIFVFFFGLSVGQNLSSPIKKILEEATGLTKGDLSGRVYLESKDELAELADAFNKIAEELQASRDQGANTEKSIDIKVRARTQELEETINALEQKIKNRTIELERLMDESKKMQVNVKAKDDEIINIKKELDICNQKNVKTKKAVANSVDSDVKV